MSPVAGPYWPAPHGVAGVAWYDVAVEVALDVAEEFVVHLVRAEGLGECTADECHVVEEEFSVLVC